MPKPASPPPQVIGRYSELEEKIRRLKERQSSVSGSDSSRVGNQINIAELEKQQLNNQFEGFPKPVEKTKIIAEPMIFSAEEILGEQQRSRPMSKSNKKRVGRTVGSRYNKDYKSKTKRDY